MICQDTANTHTGLSEHVQSESSEQGMRGQTVWWHILIPCFPTHLRRHQNDWWNIYVHQMSSCRKSISFFKKKLERLAHAVLPWQLAQSESLLQSRPRQTSSCAWDPARTVAAKRSRVIGNFISGISFQNWEKINDTEWPDGRTFYTVQRLRQLFNAYGPIHLCA